MTASPSCDRPDTLAVPFSPIEPTSSTISKIDDTCVRVTPETSTSFAAAPVRQISSVLHGGAPCVEDEARPARQPDGDRSGVDADGHGDRLVVREITKQFAYVQRERHRPRRVVDDRAYGAAGRKVFVTGESDPFEAPLLGQRVGFFHEMIQELACVVGRT